MVFESWYKVYRCQFEIMIMILFHNIYEVLYGCQFHSVGLVNWFFCLLTLYISFGRFWYQSISLPWQDLCPEPMWRRLLFLRSLNIIYYMEFFYKFITTTRLCSIESGLIDFPSGTSTWSWNWSSNHKNTLVIVWAMKFKPVIFTTKIVNCVSLFFSLLVNKFFQKF